MAVKLLDQALKGKDLKTHMHPDWCAGCGDFGIVNAIQQSVAKMQLPPWETYLISGVGCSGKTPHYINVYGSHTLHGRALAYALGAKIANPSLTVIAAGGDGDGYGIGAGHFVHAGRRNVDLAYIVFNNEVYGLTKGQASPTLERGEQPKSLAVPNINQAINPLALAIASGYTFVARSYSYDQKHLTATISAAVQHKGMALVDVLQPCPTYNNLRTKEFFAEEVEMDGVQVPRVFYLDEEGYSGKVNNPDDIDEINETKVKAMARLYKKEERVPLGIFYQAELPTYNDLLKTNIPPLNDVPGPIDLPYYDEKTMDPTTDLSAAMEEFVL